MKETLLKFLCCPECERDLILFTFHEDCEEIIGGYLRCLLCTTDWLIIDGIPRFVSNDYIKNLDSFQAFLKKYATKLGAADYSINNGGGEKDSALKELKNKTSNYFGYEWDYFKDWGWIKGEDITEEEKKYDYRGGLISNTESAFKKKCMLDAGDLEKKKLVLDAGCGNGRFTNQASKYGAEVIGVDLGYGVESAYEHLKNSKNVHIIQGDLFYLPFKKNIFDIIFSNGVLMHTGDAKKAFCSITKHIKPGGIFVSHLYPAFHFQDSLALECSSERQRFHRLTCWWTRSPSLSPSSTSTESWLLRPSLTGYGA